MPQYSHSVFAFPKLKCWLSILIKMLLTLVWRLGARVAFEVIRRFHRLFSKLKSYFVKLIPERRSSLLKWINKRLRGRDAVCNFTTDWCDGIRLCILAETIEPGICPRYDLLQSSYPINNINFALELFRNNIDIETNLTATEINTCLCETKLMNFLMQLKNAVEKRSRIHFGRTTLKTTASVDQCFIKGMGKSIGVRFRPARFSIHYGNIRKRSILKLNLVIEIVGPNQSSCKGSVEFDSKEPEITRFLQNLIMKAVIQKNATEANLKIPFFIERFENYLLFTYIPLLAGVHQISICWQGQHVFRSPYKVKIDKLDNAKIDTLAHIGLKFEIGHQYPLCLIKGYSLAKADEMATVVSKKVTKKTMVNGEAIDHETFFTPNLNPNYLKNPIKRVGLRRNLPPVLKILKSSSRVNK